MQELLLYIVQHIVHHPNDVVVTQVESEDGEHLTLRLSVNEADMGLIIGKSGNTARSLRNLLKVASTKQGRKVYLDILESSSKEAEIPTEA